MSNLSKAKEALDPEKEYNALITVTRQYSITVKAKSEEQAEEYAENEYRDGNATSISNDTIESINAKRI